MMHVINTAHPFFGDIRMSQETVNYQTDPSQYKHWSLKFEGEIATLQLNINEDAVRGLRVAASPLRPRPRRQARPGTG